MNRELSGLDVRETHGTGLAGDAVVWMTLQMTLHEEPAVGDGSHDRL